MRSSSARFFPAFCLVTDARRFRARCFVAKPFLANQTRLLGAGVLRGAFQRQSLPDSKAECYSSAVDVTLHLETEKKSDGQDH